MKGMMMRHNELGYICGCDNCMLVYICGDPYGCVLEWINMYV